VNVSSTEKRRTPRVRWGDLYHYRIAYQDSGGDTTSLLLQTIDKLAVGSVVEDKGRLIEIHSVDAHPYRGVITPLHGRLR
jgi:hypothetical protein